MITTHLHGGLGNQLFQIAAAIGAAERNQSAVAFDFSQHLAYTQGCPPTSYRSNLFRRLTNGRLSLRSPCFVENPACIQLPPNQQDLILHGYFHSLDYFADAQVAIAQLLGLDPVVLAQARSKYNLASQPNCGVHVRRGDYLSNPPANLYSLPDDYFLAAIAKLPTDTLLVVCSDDIAYCKILFEGFDCIFSQELTDVGDFYLLAACDRQIISNSTFSWWASYLSPSRVPAIAPRQWLIHQGSKPIPIQISPHLELL
jgi:hypothetical protein